MRRTIAKWYEVLDVYYQFSAWRTLLTSESCQIGLFWESGVHFGSRSSLQPTVVQQ
jgi:hypothetical protein